MGGREDGGDGWVGEVGAETMRTAGEADWAHAGCEGGLWTGLTPVDGDVCVAPWWDAPQMSMGCR